MTSRPGRALRASWRHVQRRVPRHSRVHRAAGDDGLQLHRSGPWLDVPHEALEGQSLQSLIRENAGSEGREVLLNNATVADGFAAADYRLSPKSDASPKVYSAGRFINLGEKIIQIVHLGIDGKEAPPEDVLQRFVQSFRVEGGGQGLAPLPLSSPPSSRARS